MVVPVHHHALDDGRQVVEVDHDAVLVDRPLHGDLEPVVVAVQSLALTGVPRQVVGRLEGERAADPGAHLDPGYPGYLWSARP